jgi:hypothetical protein
VLQIHILSTMCIQVIQEFSRDKVLMYTWGYQTDAVYYLALKCAQGLDGGFVIRNVVCVCVAIYRLLQCERGMLFCLRFGIELHALLYDPVELSYILDPLHPPTSLSLLMASFCFPHCLFFPKAALGDVFKGMCMHVCQV